MKPLLQIFLAGILLLLSSAGVSAMKEHPTPQGEALLQVIRDISERYNVHFTYDREIVENVEIKEYEPETYANVDDALKNVLKGTNLKYVMLKMKYVIIYQDDVEGMKSLEQMVGVLQKIIQQKKEKRQVFSLDRLQSSTDLSSIHLQKHLMVLNVSGTVTDQAGEPLIGVNIQVKGTNKGTATDFEGSFALEDIDENAVLVVSYVGYRTMEVPVVGKSDLSIVMESDSQMLEEVVVVGYGTQKKRDLTGSVSSVSSREIERVPVLGLDQALQGRAAGVFVSNNNANPGGEVNIRIRGINSIQGNNEPLYVVDGYIGGNINTVNPADIESIEVLKDASATSIYGSRGANGVIIVTTKRGKSGQTSFNFDMFQGLQTRARKIDLMGARDYAIFVNALDADRGVNLTFPDVDNLPYNTDWQDMIYRDALWQQYSLSANGGTEDINFYVSGAYVDQEGIMKETGYNRFNVRANIDAELTKNISVGARIGYSSIDRTVQTGEEIRNVDSDIGHLVGRSLSLQPTETAYDEEGNLRPLIVDFANIDRAVPLFELQNAHQKRYDNSINGNFFAEIQLIESLKFRSTYGFDVLNNKQNRYNPSTVWTTTGGFKNFASVSTTNDIGWLNENYLSFDQIIENHKLQVIGGVTLQGFNRESLGVSVSDFAVDDFLYHNLSAGATIGSPNSDMSQWKQASFFGRVQYTLSDKYFFTFNGRYDGNSKFGSDNKWGFFPSGAFAWRLSDEDFIKQTEVFSNLKLRASYGISGSEALGPYRSLAAYDAKNPTAIIGNQWAVGFVPSRLPNPDLKWETTTQMDIGLDFSFFDGRLGFVADYFNKETNDLFLNRPVPATTGLNTVQANIGSLRNTGFEIGMDARLKRGTFTWDLNLNGTLQYSEIKNLGDVEQIIFNLGSHSMSVMKVGEPLGTFFGYHTNGIWGTDDEELGEYTQFGAVVEPGDVKMVDFNDDGDVNADDRQIIGYSQPRFFGGANNFFTFKGFDLSVFLQYVSGNSVFNRTASSVYYDPESYSNKHVDYINAWRPDNQNTNVPRVGANLPTDMYDIFLEDGAFLRMREITLGYNIPSSVLERIGVSRLRLYATGTNLFVITKYSGYDPEVNYVGGSVTVLNMDNGSYPRARTMMLGLNLTF